MADPTLVNWSAEAIPSGSSFTFTPAHQPTDGNYLIFGMFQYNGGGDTTATVAWTTATGLNKPASGTWPFMINTNTSYPYTADLWAKVASAEPASYTVSRVGSTQYGLVFLAEYTNVDPSYVFDAVQVTYADTSHGASSGTFPAMTPSVIGALLANVFYDQSKSDTFTVPSQLTGHGQTANSVIGQIEMADANATSTASVGPFTWAWAPGTYPIAGGVEWQLPPASGGTTYDETLTVAGAADTTPTTSLTANAAFDVAGSVDTVPAVSLTANASFGVAGAAGVSPSGQVDFAAAFTLIGAAALSMGTGAAHTYNEVFSVGASAGLSLDVAAQVAASFVAASAADVSAQASITMDEALTLAANPDVSAQASAIYNAAVSAAANADISYSTSAVMAVSFALAATANLTAAGNVFNASAVTPLARMYQVAMESRTLQVASEERRLVVNVENRSMKA